jgi:putative ABC transport system substrate-binding protein
MKRRGFIALLGSGIAAWPLAAHAQQSERVRRVAVLVPFLDDREASVKSNLLAFRQRFLELGWNEGRNIRFDYRFTGQEPGRMRAGVE